MTRPRQRSLQLRPLRGRQLTNCRLCGRELTWSKGQDNENVNHNSTFRRLGGRRQCVRLDRSTVEQASHRHDPVPGDSGLRAGSLQVQGNAAEVEWQHVSDSALYSRVSDADELSGGVDRHLWLSPDAELGEWSEKTKADSSVIQRN